MRGRYRPATTQNRKFWSISMTDALAFVATGWGLLMGLAPSLQIRVILRTHNAAGTSLGWISILIVGFALWIAYGLSRRDWPIIITNSMSFTVAAVLIVAICVYRRPDQPVREVTSSNRV
jgi:uncharacterized protein with PQ loop repeat